MTPDGRSTWITIGLSVTALGVLGSIAIHDGESQLILGVGRCSRLVGRRCHRHRRYRSSGRVRGPFGHFGRVTWEAVEVVAAGAVVRGRRKPLGGGGGGGGESSEGKGGEGGPGGLGVGGAVVVQARLRADREAPEGRAPSSLWDR